MSNDEIIQAALKEVLSDSGSGASVDDPRRLGRIHPLLAPSMERVLISGIYGEKDKDWFDAGRRYHKDNSVCEQLIRVSRTPKPDWAQPDHIYSMYFEISEVNDSAPVPDELRKGASEAALKMPVRDASFVSRFPLTAIKARDAQEAARTIAGYLAQAQADGWRIGSARALVDDWRNEYELTKGEDKTVFRFDMRPMLMSSSRLDLVALTLIAGTPKLEEVIRNFGSVNSWPEAFAEAGLSFVDTSEPKTQSIAPSSPEQVTSRSIAAGSGSSMSSGLVEETPEAGPPGGWARYRQSRKPFNLRDRINMLNGFYGCVGSYTIALKTPDYLKAAARESVSVPANSMGFITQSKQLYLNVDQSQAVSDVSYAYVRHPTVTILHGPTFADAVRYGFYRLVCTFVRKEEFPTEGDVIQHVNDLQKWEWEARTRDPARHSRLVLQDIKTTLQFMKEFAEGTPLEAAVVKAQKGERKKSLPAYFIAAMIFVAMPLAAAVVYYFTNSGLYATGAFFSPILFYWLWMGWVIRDAQRLINDSKRKFPDTER